MNQKVGKDAMAPYEEDRKFVYGLCIQVENDSLINYIATKFNSIPKHDSRKLKVYDWICAIEWVIERVKHYDTYDLVKGFSLRCFNTEMNDSEFEHLNKSLYFLKNIKDYENIEMVGNEVFNKLEMPEYPPIVYNEFYKEDILEENKKDFFQYSLEEQRSIITVYNSYLYNMQHMTVSMDESEIFDYTITNMVLKELTEPFKTNENIAIVEKICKNLTLLKEKAPKDLVTDDEISQLLTNGLFVNSNMILTAYYLQYILISLGASIPKNQTPFGVSKVIGKQADIMQHLLCAATTQNWETVKQKGNSYYVTINRMFKFDSEIIEEKNSVIKHLKKVREKLAEGGFVDAIKLLDEDLEKIRNYK